MIALAFFFFEVQSQTREKKTMGSNLTLDSELDYTMCSEEKPNCRSVNGLQSNPWFCTKLHDVFRRDARRIAILSMGSNPTLDVFKFRRDAE